MLGKTIGIGGAVAGLVLCSLAAPAHAVILNFSGEITSCTPTCDSFAFLGTGSLLVGTMEFDDAALADGTWTGGDVLNLSFSVFDPAMPHHGPTNPPDPVADNRSRSTRRRTVEDWWSPTASPSRIRAGPGLPACRPIWVPAV